MAKSFRFTEMVQWAMKNTNITYDEQGLIVGNFKDKRFRIFRDEEWAGVIKKGGDWTRSMQCLNLDDFRYYLGESDD